MGKKRYIAKKMTGGSYGDDGYYWKVVDTKDRSIKARDLSRFDAKCKAESLNKEDEALDEIAKNIHTEEDFFKAMSLILKG